MTAIVISLVTLLLGLLAGGVWIGLSLAITGTVLVAVYRNVPVGGFISHAAWNILTTQELLALPLFILMGEILFRTGLSKSLFKGLAPWAGLLPGRLLHVNVIGCSIFSAISGSSSATTQVVGRVTLDELLSRGYDKNIAMGSLAGAGTLGFLIPPSSIMIIYGVLAQVSVLKLFAAGLIPGLLLAGCFMAWVMIHTTIRPSLVPSTEQRLSDTSWMDRVRALKDLAPTALLIVCVLGSMYSGLATPSEAAAFGVVGALTISYLQRTLTRVAIAHIGRSSVITCAMIALILLGASILGGALAFLGIPSLVSAAAKSLALPPLALVVALILFYLVLGCFLEGFSMIVMTIPVTLPIVVAAGYDPVWFGIFLVLVVEMAQIHPPVGFNLFVIQSITGEDLMTITKATLPYLLILMLFTLFVAVFPQVVMWLPKNI